MKSKSRIVVLAALAATLGAGCPSRSADAPAAKPAAPQASQAPQVDARIPKYVRVPGISGNLNSVGSDTMNNLMALWAEGFQKHYPGVKIQVEGKGSSTAPPALIEGAAQLGPMSRAMKSSETDAFEQHYGFPPTQIATSLDALAVWVHRDNPIDFLTMPQVDAIFSKTRKCGGATDVTTWGQLGIKGKMQAAPISLYGRNSASGTYGYFKEHALCKGDYRDTVKEQPGSASVVQGITEDAFGIGYSGIGYRTSGVKALALAPDSATPMREPTLENVLSGAYPLSRYLFLYIVKDPGRPMDPLTREFVLYVLSAEGQEVVVKDGYLPLPYETVQKMREAVQK